MIWLTWRQFRAAATMTLAALAVLAAVLGLTGPGLADDYSTVTAACDTDSRICSDFYFHDNQASFYAVTAIVLVLPALVGIFWGAPLISREFEAGTHRLAWNQSITRTRWLAAKLGLIGLAAMTATGLGSLAVTWWSSPIDKAGANVFSRMEPLLFPGRGIVPIGYAAFAFTLGVAAGMLLRRTLPAMAVTLAVFVAVQVAMPLLVRPHLLPSTTRSTIEITEETLVSIKISPGAPGRVPSSAGAQSPRSHGFAEYVSTLDGITVPRGGAVEATVRTSAPDMDAWILSNQIVDASGHAVDTFPLPSSGACAAPARGSGQPLPEAQGGPPLPVGGQPAVDLSACFTEMKQHGYRQQVTYHPASRFWHFQWHETGIYTALAFGLAGFCFWWIRRRRS